MSSVYHAGEIEVQTCAGVRVMARRAGSSIHSTFDQAAAEFLAEQPMVIVGSTDRAGHIWASILAGKAGFAHVIDEQTARIQAIPDSNDPLAAILAGGDVGPVSGSAEDLTAPLELGLLVIDLETRDRMRVNGPAEADGDGGLFVHAREVYFNCPKYIQARQVAEADFGGTNAVEADPVTRAEALSLSQQAWIAAADTFFIASALPGGRADASHRGGNPGFVRVRDALTLEWPDYSGNTMFNTLGNITVNSNAGLLFLDFERGDTLQLTGQSTIVWEPERSAPFPGAERIVEFRVEQTLQMTHAVPLRFRFLQYSRFNPG